MKILMSMLLCAFLSTGLHAQTAKARNQADIDRDAAKLKSERQERNRDIKRARLRTAHFKQIEIDKDRKDFNAERKELKMEGVKQPAAQARKQD